MLQCSLTGCSTSPWLLDCNFFVPCSSKAHLKLMAHEGKISTITLKSQPEFFEWTEMALTPYATRSNKPAVIPGIGGGGS